MRENMSVARSSSGHGQRRQVRRLSNPTAPSRPGSIRRLRLRRGDAGQAALVVVVALTVALATVSATMVTTITNNDPIIKQASIQHYAYRALASGINAYTSAINADPYLAACNVNTNYPSGAD